jgi:hypothetical protein
MTLLLTDGTRLFGVVGDRSAVPFEAVFGRIEVPITSIRLVDLRVELNGSKAHRIHFLNGDTITGQVGAWPHVRFRTAYGELTVPLSAVIRIVSSEPAEGTSVPPKGTALATTAGVTPQGGVTVPAPSAVPIAAPAPAPAAK